MNETIKQALRKAKELEARKLPTEQEIKQLYQNTLAQVNELTKHLKTN